MKKKSKKTGFATIKCEKCRGQMDFSNFMYRCVKCGHIVEA